MTVLEFRIKVNWNKNGYSRLLLKDIRLLLVLSQIGLHQRDGGVMSVHTEVACLRALVLLTNAWGRHVISWFLSANNHVSIWTIRTIHVLVIGTRTLCSCVLTHISSYASVSEARVSCLSLSHALLATWKTCITSCVFANAHDVW